MQREFLRLEQPAALLVQPVQRNRDGLIALGGEHPRAAHNLLLGRNRAGQPVLSDFRGHLTRSPAPRVKPHFGKVTRSCVVLAYGQSVTVDYSIAQHRLVQHC